MVSTVGPGRPPRPDTAPLREGQNMRRIAWLMVAALGVAIASPALAGAAGKCTQTAQACLDSWAKGKDKPWAGLKYDTAENGTTTVKAITPGSPAATAGFEVGDVLVSLNGVKLTDKEALKQAKSAWKVGTVVNYAVKRGSVEKQIPLTLASMPPEVFASMVGSHMLENHVNASMAEAGSPGNITAAPAEKK